MNKGMRRIIILIIIIFLLIVTIIVEEKIRNKEKDLMKFTQNQEELYYEFAESYDDTLLIHSSPVEILKFYLYAEDTNDYLTAYQFLSSSEGNRMLSKQDYLIGSFRKTYNKNERKMKDVIERIKRDYKEIEVENIKNDKVIIEIKYKNIDNITPFVMFKKNNVWKIKWKSVNRDI
ncbi:hypothetical protein [Clostridium sp. DL1XJH146]